MVPMRTALIISQLGKWYDYHGLVDDGFDK